MFESYITDVQLVEGIAALLTYLIVWFLFWTKLPFDGMINKYNASALRWICIWFGRKYLTSFYVSLKKKYKVDDYKICVLPKPGIYKI